MNHVYRKPTRIAARDRYRASMHEAAHYVLAKRAGVDVYATITPTGIEGSFDEKAYVGRCSLRATNDAAKRMLIGVAGVVGEFIALGWCNDDDAMLEIYVAMSPTDKDYAGVAAVGVWFDETRAFIDAVEEAHKLLTGSLSTKWRAVARSLRRNALVT